MKIPRSKSAYISSFNDIMELGNYSPQTINAYSTAISSFFNFVKMDKNESCDFMEYCKMYLLYLRRSKRSWGTVNIHYSALKLFCVRVLSTQWDMDKLPRPKTEKRLVRLLSKQEVKAILISPQSLKHRAMLYLFYATGLRISELVNLKLGDIDSDRKEIFVRRAKGAKDRIVDLPPCVIPILREYYRQYRPKVYLFEGCSKNHAMYSHSSIHKILVKAKKKTKIEKPLSAHTFRHCYATHHLENGTDLVYIKEQLGHKDLATTEKYIHLCGHRARRIHHPIEDLQIDIMESII